MFSGSMLEAITKTDDLVIGRVMPHKYEAAKDFQSELFNPEERGLFGIEQKVILLDVAEDDQTFIQRRDGLLLQLKGKQGKIRELSQNEIEEFDIKTLIQKAENIEFSYGLFNTPLQFRCVDAVIQNQFAQLAFGRSLKPLYAGHDPIEHINSYGFHMHYSAGNIADSLLLYVGLRNELWRITAFSANSPHIDINGHVHSMCNRLGNTYIKFLTPRGTMISTEDLVNPDEMKLKKGNDYPRYPLNVRASYGTVEMRAADLDIRGAATVAYSYLLAQALQEQIESEGIIPILYARDLNKNMRSVKRHGISDQDYVTALTDEGVVKEPIQENMIMHFETVINPLLQRLKAHYRQKGVTFIHPDDEQEMRDRIYHGRTPAQRQVERFREVRPTASYKEALYEMMRLNIPQIPKTRATTS